MKMCQTQNELTNLGKGDCDWEQRSAIMHKCFVTLTFEASEQMKTFKGEEKANLGDGLLL